MPAYETYYSLFISLQLFIAHLQLLIFIISVSRSVTVENLVRLLPTTAPSRLSRLLLLVETTSSPERFLRLVLCVSTETT